MYKISDIARLFHISTKTLRFYEERGLLVPQRNEINGYRYYSDESIGQLAVILHLKQANMPIADISACVRSNQKIESALNHLLVERQRLDKLIQVVSSINTNDNSYTIYTGYEPAGYIYRKEYILSNPKTIEAEFTTLLQEVIKHEMSLQFPFYYFAEYMDEAFTLTNIHVSIFLKLLAESIERMKNEMPKEVIYAEGYDYIYVLHCGDYEQIDAAYAFLDEYVKQNHLIVDGYPIECYCVYGSNEFFSGKQLTEVRYKIHREETD